MSRKASGESTEDFDQPLDSSMQKKVDADFKSLYNYVLSPDVTPSDPLFGRLFREFRKRCISVYPLVKVRSASQSPLLQSGKYRKIANDISVAVGNVQELPDLSFDSPMLLMWALRVLVNGWAKAGTGLVLSKLFPSYGGPRRWIV